MNDRSNQDSLLDKWLADQYASLELDLSKILDLETGFQDATLSDQHERLKEDIRSSLDLETGLSAVLSISLEPFADAPESVSQRDEDSTLELQWESDLDRLQFRTHTMSPPSVKCDCIRTRKSILKHISRRVETIQALIQADDALGEDITVKVEQLSAAVDQALENFDRAFIADLDNLRNLVRSVIQASSLDVRQQAVHEAMIRLSSDLDRLEAMANDFTQADLRNARLDDLLLTGIRWSEQTKWPTDWEDQIRSQSKIIGPGTFVIIGDDPLTRHDA